MCFYEKITFISSAISVNFRTGGRPREIIKMASNLVELAEMGISAETSTNINNTENVKHTNSTKGYTLNIDRALRNKINACKKVNVDYNFTGGGITGEMDTATFELFRAACTTFYSRLPLSKVSAL